MGNHCVNSVKMRQVEGKWITNTSVRENVPRIKTLREVFGSKKRAPSVSEPEHKEQISLCPPCQKLTQYWGALKGSEKASEVSSCPPTDATMREQLFELESVLSESSHVCPTDWMSCIRKGGGGTGDFVLDNF